MRDTGKITITMSEYKRLLYADTLIEIITNRAKTEKYFGKDDIRAMLGIPEKEDEE